MSTPKKKKMTGQKKSVEGEGDTEMAPNNSIISVDNNSGSSKDSKSEEIFLPKSLSHIKNKDRRRENLLRLKATERKIKIEAKKKKKALEKALGDKAPPKEVG